jgi:NADH-quinone oxidoreductase subunit M
MLSNFVGEFLVLSSTFIQLSKGWVVAASLGVILGAAYMLWLVQRIFYGPESELAASKSAVDLHFRELAAVWPLAVLMLVMGLAPSFWLPTIGKDVHLPQAKESVVLPAPPTVYVIPSQGEGQR